jgi:hypothetical protein
VKLLWDLNNREQNRFGGIMFRVISLNKTGNADPQQYTLVMKDLRSTQKGYLGCTETGMEEAIRSTLKKGGMPEAEIDVAFQRTKSG